MTDHEGRSSVWVSAALIAVGVITVAGGAGALYLAGACGFQADPAEAADCARRWRRSGAIVTAAGTVLVAWGIRRALRPRGRQGAD